MTLKSLAVLFLTLVLIGCAGIGLREWDARYGASDPQRFDGPHPTLASAPDFSREIKPILDSRCVVCHACYDAPCQLQLGSYPGVTRGGSKLPVYDPARLKPAEPSRLFVDAKTNLEWRNKGFFPVLNEREPTPTANREASVLARLLELKQESLAPTLGALPENRYDFRLDRDAHCPQIETFESYRSEHPEWGMPYGFPGLSKEEHATVMRWIEGGAPGPYPSALPAQDQAAIAQWEAFLNAGDPKSQLMARYVFEHWFLGDIQFPSTLNGRYYELVRSRTPSPRPIDLIATRRPTDDPGNDRVYYRFRLQEATPVAKTLLPLRLDPARMQRLKGWFIDLPYTVPRLPDYRKDGMVNPFVAYQAIPVLSRYRFMLDDARFYVMGFIKGPSCRGQTALGVITDYFWVGFVDPSSPPEAKGEGFLTEALAQIDLPTDQSSDASLFKWIGYSKQQSYYLARKSAYLSHLLAGQDRVSFSMLWDGDGTNPNAALTVFRHFDSASVEFGLLGEKPQTALIIGYAVFERIHYLLVAGFDVFGNLAHQLQSRLYMDFLRMEGEQNFLTVLPRKDRDRVRDFWYRDAGDDVKNYLSGTKAYYDQETLVDYKTDDTLSEAYGLWRQRVAKILDRSRELGDREIDALADPALRQLSGLKGRPLSYLAEVSFLTLEDGAGHLHHYSLLRNSAHSNIAELFAGSDSRRPDEDTLTLAKGFIGAYPNVYFRLKAQELPDFVGKVATLTSEQDYRVLAARYAVRRTNPEFWIHNDRLVADYRRLQPVEGALFDLNRYENR